MQHRIRPGRIRPGQIKPGHAKPLRLSLRGFCRLQLRFCVSLAMSACSVGTGEGSLSGTLQIADCEGGNGPFALNPSFFAGETIEGMLNIRMQHGSAIPLVSDGIVMLVRDALAVQQRLNQPIPVSDAKEISEGAALRITLFLNETCPREPEENPVVLKAIGGTATFAAIYAPDGDPDALETAAVLDQLQFVDERESELGSANLSGRFRFVFNRGRPAQAFP